MLCQNKIVLHGLIHLYNNCAKGFYIVCMSNWLQILQKLLISFCLISYTNSYKNTFLITKVQLF